MWYTARYVNGRGKERKKGKMMRRFIFAVFACVCMTLVMMPASVFAESSNSVEVGNVSGGGVILDAQKPYAMTDEDGNVTTEDADEENYNIKFKDGVLTLKNAFIDSTGPNAINSEGGDLVIELIGDNTVASGDFNGGDSIAVNVNKGNLTVKGEGSLSATGGKTVGENNFSDGIRATGDIAIEADVTATGSEAYYSGGIYSESGITVNADVTATGNGAAGGSAGIGAGNGDIVISGGTVKAVSKSNYDTEPYISGGIYAEKGNVVINGNNTNVTATGGIAEYETIGIGAEEGSVMIESGTVTAEIDVDSYAEEIAEGIRAGKNVDISGGDVIAGSGEALYCDGIYAEEGDVTISGEGTRVEATGGRGEYGESAGIRTGNGSIAIKSGTVIATSEYCFRAKNSSGIKAAGNIDISGGDVMAVACLEANDGMSSEYSGGIYSVGGDVNISENARIVAMGGCSSQSSIGIGAEGGDLKINSGSVTAASVEGDSRKSYGLGAAAGDNGGGNIDISGGSVDAVGMNSGIMYDGVLKASPAQKKMIVMEILKTVLESENNAEVLYNTKSDPVSEMMEYLRGKAAQIDGSPFVKETVVKDSEVKDMEYFRSYTADYNGGVTGGQDEMNTTGKEGTVNDAEAAKTGDENNPGLWIAIAVMAVLIAGGTVLTGIKRRQER